MIKILVRFFLFFIFIQFLLIVILVIKEWAIFGIRNICEDNEENQQLIASLEAQGVANYPPEFDQMGLKLEVDGNRIKLRNKQM